MLQKKKTHRNRNRNRNIQKKTKTKTKKQSKTHKLYKQNGKGFMNNITGNLFTNTNTQPQNINQKDIITIIYNRNTPKMTVINNSSPNGVYQSSFVQTVPHIQMTDYDNFGSHYILVLILPGAKPQLLWAIEIKGGAKSKSILDYVLPRYKDGFQFKILFKLHKYHKNIKETFNVANSMTKERHSVFNDLKSYLTNNNMLNATFFKEVNVEQDKGQNISQFLLSF